jgi:ketosteroid isomerase-like protein
MNTTHAADRTGQKHDEAEIRQLMEQTAAAMRARDAERLVARYAPEIVQFSLAPPLKHAGSEVRDPDGLRRWFSGFDGPIDYEIRDLVLITGADVAFCHSLNRLSATPQGTAEKFDLWFRSTIGLRKIGGAWRIVHEHMSTPFYMDGTFGAAVDLQP